MKLKATPVTVFVGLILLFAVAAVVSALFNIAGTLFTLDFLPSGIYRYTASKGSTAAHRINDGTVSTVIVPALGHILNYINVLLINAIDFLCWPFSFIPLLNKALYRLYAAPDMDLALTLTHRNFVTHSAANPLFLIYLFIAHTITRFSKSCPLLVRNGLKLVCCLFGLSFAAHLLADTMPAAWLGYARVRIGIFGHLNLLTLSPFFSKLWLLLNGYLSLWLTKTFLYNDKQPTQKGLRS